MYKGVPFLQVGPLGKKAGGAISKRAVRILEGKPYLKHVGPKIYIIDKSNINSFDYASSLAPADWKPVFTVN